MKCCCSLTILVVILLVYLDLSVCPNLWSYRSSHSLMCWDLNLLLQQFWSDYYIIRVEQLPVVGANHGSRGLINWCFTREPRDQSTFQSNYLQKSCRSKLYKEYLSITCVRNPCWIFRCIPNKWNWGRILWKHSYHHLSFISNMPDTVMIFQRITSYI